jgi:hypothetical protein
VQVAQKLSSALHVLEVSDTEMAIAINDPDEVPDIVSRLVQGGARIRSVLLQREDIEEVFLRLCKEGT